MEVIHATSVSRVQEEDFSASLGFFDFEGIRFSPKMLVFDDVFEGEKRVIEFSLQNVSGKPLQVRLEPPTSLAFMLVQCGSEPLLAPGLTLFNTISFTSYRRQVTSSSIRVHVGNNTVDYKIRVQVAKANLVVTPYELDFGNVDMDSPAVIRYLTLQNTGSLGTKYAIDLGTNELQMKVMPLKGYIRAKNEVKVRFEIVGLFKGEHSKSIWIKCKKVPLRVQVRIHVIQPHLVVHHPQTTGEFTLIDFPVTYFDTQRHEVMVVRNIGAETCMFVVLAEVNNELMGLSKAKKTYPDFDMFTIEPSEGRIESFEGRIFTLNFYPKYDIKEERSRHEKISKDVLIFLRVMRIQFHRYTKIEEDITHFQSMAMSASIEKELIQAANMDLPTDSISTAKSSIKRSSILQPRTSQVQVARLCLHGEALSPEVGLLPTMIDLGTVSYGTTHVRVLRITNLCTSLPMNFKYRKVPFIEMNPSYGEIEPGKSLEVTINVTANVYGPNYQKIKIDIFGRSSPMLQEPTLVKLDCYKLSVKFICQGKAILQAAVFNMGITPMVTNEVGKLTDGMKFRSAFLAPEAAMVNTGVCKNRPWMKKEIREEKSKLSKEKTSAASVEVNQKKSCGFTECQVCNVLPACHSYKSTDMNVHDSNLNKTSKIHKKTVDGVAVKICKRYSKGSSCKLVAMNPKTTKKISVGSSCRSPLQDFQSICKALKKGRQKPTEHAQIEDIQDINEIICMTDYGKTNTLKNSIQSVNATPSALSGIFFPVSEVSISVDSISCLKDDKTLSISNLNRSRDESNCGQLRVPETCMYQSSSKILHHKHILVSSDLAEELKSDNIQHNGQHTVKIQMSKATPVLESSTHQLKSLDRSRCATEIKGSSASVSSQHKTPASKKKSNTSACSVIKNGSEHLLTHDQNTHSAHNAAKNQQTPVITLSKSSLNASNVLTIDRKISSASVVRADLKNHLKFPNLATSEKRFSENLSVEFKKYLGLDSNVEVPTTKPYVSSKHNSQLAERVLIPEWKKNLSLVSDGEVNKSKTIASNNPNLLLPDKVLQNSSIVKRTNTSMPIESKGILKSKYVRGKNLNLPPTKPKTRKKGHKKKPVVVQDSRSSTISSSSVSKLELLPKVVLPPVALPNRNARVRQCATHLYMLEQARSAEPQDALVALPNDRAQSLRPWPTGKITRTIFTGIPRYAAPVDRDYAFTPKEARAHQKHEDHYLRYMRTVARQWPHQTPPSIPEYQVANSHLYQMMGICPPKAIPKQGQLLQERSPPLQPKTNSLVQILMPLTPLQIYNVKIHPKHIHFGQVAPNSNSVEKFYFENLNPFPVKIHMIPGSSGVSVPQGEDNMILKPHQREEILMMYNAEGVGQYNGYMDYIINNNHSFLVTITAEVIPKLIVLLCNSLLWGHESMGNAFPSHTQFVAMRNPLQAYCNFSWKKHTDIYPFYITPEKGNIPPNRVLLCEVRYNPKYRCANYQEMILHTESGSMERLYCKKMKHKPFVYFVDRQLDIHQIPLNLPRVFHTLIFNSNYEDMAFMVENSSPMPGCTVTPSTGIIQARSCLILELHMKVNQVVDIDFTLFVDIQQDLQLELKVIGSVQYPKVLIKPEVLRLRQISADSTDSLLVNFKNNGTVEAIIQINMSDFPEFHLSATPKKLTPAFGENGFQLLPKESKDLYLIFNPIDVATYEFYMPIIINGLLGPPNIDNHETTKTEFYLHQLKNSKIDCRHFPSHLPLLKVDCTVAGHIITFSTHQFNFALLPGNTQHSKTIDELHVMNTTYKSVTYCIVINEIEVPSSPFLLQYKAGQSVKVFNSLIIGTLQPGEYTTFEATFVPNGTGLFNAVTPIHIHEYGDNRVFNYLFFRGLHPAPLLKTEVSQIVFGPIPLCVNSTQLIYLEACHYSNDSKVCTYIRDVYDEEVNHNLSDTLTLKFLNGNTIQKMKGVVSLGLHVIFRSEWPVSFRTEIVFSDDRGSECHISVIATADNSILTTHAFLHTQSDKYSLLEVGASTKTSSMEDSELNDDHIKYVLEGCSSNTTDSQSSVYKPETVEISTMEPVPPNICNKTRTPVLVLKNNNSSSALTAENINYSSISMVDSVADNQSQGIKQNTSVSSNLAEGRPLAFPLYPSVDDDADYTHHMDHTIMAAERWLYEQGFQCSFGAKIPRGLTAMMAGYYTPQKRAFQRRSNAFEMKTILNVLYNLIGPDVLKYFNIKPLPEETEERVQYQLAQHILLLKLLKKQGACLAHVKPSYLLTYADYLVHIDCKKKYCDNKHNEPKTFTNEKQMGEINQEMGFSSKQGDKGSKYSSVLTEEKFNRLCKQAWLDVVLQIAKTLHLDRVISEGPRTKRKMPCMPPSLVNITNNHNVSRVNMTTTLNSNSELNDKKSPLDSNVYSTSERILLAWLSTVFNKNRTKLWNNSDYPQYRTIINFDHDLSDGLVLAVVTGSYCPYLVKEFFGDLYMSPKSLEQAYHNAGRLITAWRTVRLGFTMYVEDIVHPNVVMLVLLVKHLYSQLPTLYPGTTVHFNTPLATEVTRSIHFWNPCNKRVVFKADFIGDPQKFFTVTNPGTTIYLKAYEKVNINIKFTAKMISKFTATLILSGGAVASNFARSHTFRLEGDSSSLRVTSTFNLSAPMYRPTSLTLPIYPPFPVNAEYDIMYTETEPKNANTFSAVPWQELCMRKVPRRLFLGKSHLQVLDFKTVTPLNITLACLNPKTCVSWLAFMNPSVGDFIIKLVVTPKKQHILRNLTTYFPSGWQTVVCQCLHPKRSQGIANGPCPLRTVIKIPSRNSQLWKAIATMFEKTLDAKEKDFWIKHFETNIGLRLIQWMVGSEKDSVSEEFQHIFNVEVTYDVTCSQPLYVRTAEKITISDVRLNTTVDLPIHVSNHTPPNIAVQITLTSVDRMEIRNYRVEFQSPPDLPPQPSNLSIETNSLWNNIYLSADSSSEEDLTDLDECSNL